MLIINLFSLLMIHAQFTQTQEQKARQDSIRKISEQDHKQLMAMLGIAMLRPGANGGDPNAANAANYDEAKANPFPNLPDPLIFNNGKKVKSEKIGGLNAGPELAHIYFIC